MTSPIPADQQRPRPTDPGEELTPELALSLAERQRIRVDATHLIPVAVILIAWGLAWGIGFLLIWIAAAPFGGEAPLSPGTAVIVLGVLIAAALVASAVLGGRMGRGRRGESGLPGIVYGLSWTGGTVAVLLLGLALERGGAGSEALALYYPAAYALVVGLLFLTGAALFRAIPLLLLGGWTLIVGILAPFFGTPLNQLLMSILGGAGFLLTAVAVLIAAGILRSRGRILSEQEQRHG